MALDHALAACLRDGEAVLRLYGWSRPTVSFGRNEPARALYGGPFEARRRPEARRGAASPLDFVRRPTGGRAVVHVRELTYAVVAPLHAWGGLRAAYVAINEALGAALRALGAPVALAEHPEEPEDSGAGGGVRSMRPAAAGAVRSVQRPAAGSQRSAGARALRPDAGPCFRSPAPGEVIAGGRKLIGSAQARLEGALLQHGSILLEDDQGLLLSAASAAADRRADRAAGAAADRAAGAAAGAAAGTAGSAALAAGYRPATLRELVGDISIDDLTDLVAMSLRETFGGRWAAGGWRRREIEAADRLEAERYARHSWTWRR